MAKKVVAIIGTYRKGRVIDTAVCEVLRGAQNRGCETQAIYLLDKHIEFCTNCRTCTQEANVGRRGQCVHNDDMGEILRAVDEADGLVLGAPTNFYNVNALTRRFIERLLPYAWWPWSVKAGPKLRAAQPDKKAVIVTSMATPAFLARILIPGPRRALKIAARTVGARVVKSLQFGMVAATPEATLGESDLLRAYRAGERLAESLARRPEDSGERKTG
jgi:multimeric flavodoxin WrbA